MAAKKPKKPQPNQPQQPEQPKQTLLSILPKKVEEPNSEPPTQSVHFEADEQVLADEPVKVDEPVLASERQQKKPITVKTKPVKRILTQPLPTESDLQPPNKSESDSRSPTPQNEPLKAEEPKPETNKIFQAVGIIVGDVRFDEEAKGTITIAQKEYQLFYASKHRYAYEALQKEVKANGGEKMRLIVYPRVMHFPSREQPYLLSFQLVGFDRSRESTGIAKQLQDFEFRLCGLWQFIPVCQTPCISVFKNFNKERLEYIKSAEADKKVRFMKASHIPLLWRDAPVRPFRFNPKLEKEQQGHSSFVEVLAKFLPERDVFGFSQLLSEPMEKAPNFLKARKEDKAEALKNKLAQNREKTGAKKSVWSKPKKKE